jgi:AAA+ ATPase superfamily predicted ATPase
MNSFVGRDDDLDRLRTQLDQVGAFGTGRLVWLRGRRRIGKSRLVQEFCDASDYPYCFYQAPRRGRAEALGEFEDAVRDSNLPSAAAFTETRFDSWSAALTAAAQRASRERPSILVIDELPYLTENDPGFAADLQKAWDRALERSPVLVICVGSDARMMQELVQERSPLHGRPTLELALDPLTPPAVAQITGANDPSDAIDRYLIVGGFPLLASRWPRRETVTTFLQEALVDDHPFVTTALRVMASEFDNALSAREVIEAIGHGETAHGRIAARAGVSGSTLSGALDVLVDSKRLVERRVPYAVPLGRKRPRYTVIDPYLRFWLRFVGPHLSEISRGRGDLTAARVIRDWNAYRGRAVEPIIRRALERLLLDDDVASRLQQASIVGSYWTRNNEVEVDLVGGDGIEPTAVGFVGSIKWHERERFTRDERAALIEHRAAVPGAAGAALVIASRTGVAPGVQADFVLDPERVLTAWR